MSHVGFTVRFYPPELHHFIKKWSRKQDSEDYNAKLSEHIVVIQLNEIQIAKKLIVF